MRGLKGKRAIVTGGTSGIGYATAKRLLEEGTSVLITGRNREKGEAAAESLGQAGQASVYFMAGDMAQESTCIETVRYAMELFGQVDYLVNNAFSFVRKAWIAQRTDWLRAMEAGPINYATMIQQFFLQRGEKVPGAIVNVSSISAYVAQPRSWTYNAAKGAVRQLTKCAAMDLAPWIRVNSISPGTVWTEELKGIGRNAELYANGELDMSREHMLKRMIEPEECANAIVFLLSDEASAITATDLPVDMGYLSAGPAGLPEEHMGDTCQDGYVGTF